MLFNSLHYFVFAPLVIAVYFALPWRWQRAWLLLVSLYFYAVFKPPFTLLLIFSIGATFLFVRAMSVVQRKPLRLALLWCAILANLSLLYFFKFIDFSFELWNGVLGVSPADDLHVWPWGVILPMGISFFTLQAIGYAVDVYRGNIPASRNFFHFSLFLSFFPQLVAGPIMRARDLLHQFEEVHRFRRDDLRAGVAQIVMGFFKKTIIADPAGVVVDQVYAAPGEFGWHALWIAAILHSLQIYGDFSGYTDIAIGTARIMGFRIPENFRRPFLSRSMTEVWTRWHISLSSWLRDYVYIPLGGNRVSVPRAYFNIFITMFISGVWHGAGLNYITWGLLHAIAVVVERFLGGFAIVQAATRRIPVVLKQTYGFLLFSFALFWFRGRALPETGGPAETGFWMAERALGFASGAGVTVPVSLLTAIGLLAAYEIIEERKPGFFDGFWKNDFALTATAAIVLGYCAIVYATSRSAPFVYFQF